MPEKVAAARPVDKRRRPARTAPKSSVLDVARSGAAPPPQHPGSHKPLQRAVARAQVQTFPDMPSASRAQALRRPTRAPAPCRRPSAGTGSPGHPGVTGVPWSRTDARAQAIKLTCTEQRPNDSVRDKYPHSSIRAHRRC